MNGYEMVALVVFLITTGITICSVVDSLNPKPHNPLNKFDAIDKELKRLHDQADSSTGLRTAAYEQINKLTDTLISEK